MFISKVRIKGFRNFQDTKIEFHEGINVIIGHNNAGKSNILHAIRFEVDSCFREAILRYRVFYDIITYPHMNGEVAMPVSYDKLWKILIDKKMKRSDLKDAAGISFNVLGLV